MIYVYGTDKVMGFKLVDPQAAIDHLSKNPKKGHPSRPENRDELGPQESQLVNILGTKFPDHASFTLEEAGAAAKNLPHVTVVIYNLLYKGWVEFGELKKISANKSAITFRLT